MSVFLEVKKVHHLFYLQHIYEFIKTHNIGVASAMIGREWSCIVNEVALYNKVLFNKGTVL